MREFVIAVQEQGKLEDKGPKIGRIPRLRPP